MKPLLGFVLIGLFILGHAEVWGADWHYLGDSEGGQYYLDRGNISLLSENTATVWIKIVLTDRGVIEVIKRLGIGYENSSEVVQLNNLNCIKKTSRVLFVTYFSKGGRSIGSSETGDFNISKEWFQIIPGTFSELIYNEVCEHPEIKKKIAAYPELMKTLGEKNKKEGETFLADNKKKEGVKTLPSGLQFKVVKDGAGKKPKLNDTVTVHYRGTFIDGTEFDNSYKRGQPTSFPVSSVIEGWTEALQLMEEGAKWQLFLPPQLAYGERGAGPIGPNSTLIFDVELISIRVAK